MEHINKIREILQPYFDCDSRRLDFISKFVASLIRARTVVLSNLSVMFNPKVKSECNYRRMQRFFEKCEIDYSQIAILWCYLIGLWIEKSITVRVKNHGKKAKSTFRKGLDHFVKILSSFENLKYESECIFKVLSCT